MKDRAFKMARNRNCLGYEGILSSMLYKFLDKKTGSGVNVNKQLAEELHKLVIKKFKRRKVYARFNKQYLGSRFG